MVARKKAEETSAGDTVTVQDGVARLTGTVDTWYENSVAVDKALKGGAKYLQNHLQPKYGPLDFGDIEAG
jgi:hypothetical protein